MEWLGLIVLLGIAGAIYSSAYKSGKRDGSRKGYGVGFDRGRRSRRHPPHSAGCVVLAVTLALLTVAAAALAR